MKPSDCIDEKCVPSEDGFSPHNVDEKLELRRSIKKMCRSWIFITFIAAVIFVILGTIFLVDHSYCIATISIVFALIWGFVGFVYYHTLRASSAQEMQHYFNKFCCNSIFITDDSLIRVLVYGAGAIVAYIFGLEHDFHWYVTLLVFIIIALLIAVILWTWRKYESGNFPQDDKIEYAIERLRLLEEK